MPSVCCCNDNTIIQYNTKFVKRHVAVASEAIIAQKLLLVPFDFGPQYVRNCATAVWLIVKRLLCRIEHPRPAGG